MASINCENCGKEISSEAAACPQCGHPNKVPPPPQAPRRGMGCGSLLAILGGLALFGVVASMVATTPTPTGRPTAEPARVQEPSEKEVALAAINLTKLKWTTGGFDNIMMLDAVVQNNGTRDVKDIAIECVHFSKSQTRIDSNRRTVYDVFPADKSTRVKDFNMGFIHNQAETTRCRAVDLVVLPAAGPQG